MKNGSEAAGIIYIWVSAADKFEKVKKHVKPLQKNLAEAKGRLAIVEADLAKARGALETI